MNNYKKIAINMVEGESCIFANQEDADKLATTICQLKQPNGNYYLGTVKKSAKEDSWSGFKVWKTNKRPVHISKRNQKILDMWNSGEHTYESIGDEFFISRERIRQILAKEKKKGFKILSTSDAAKDRTKHKLMKIIKTINPEDFASKYHNGASVEEITDYFDISIKIFYQMIEELTEKNVISHRSKVLNEIKYDVENISEIQKYREKIILAMRAKNEPYRAISEELQISKPRLSQTIKSMKDRGIDVPNSRNSGMFLSREETLLRVNNIDKCLDDGMNMRQISIVLGIAEQTVKKLIYRYLIKK